MMDNRFGKYCGMSNLNRFSMNNDIYRCHKTHLLKLHNHANLTQIKLIQHATDSKTKEMFFINVKRVHVDIYVFMFLKL